MSGPKRRRNPGQTQEGEDRRTDDPPCWPQLGEEALIRRIRRQSYSGFNNEQWYGTAGAATEVEAEKEVEINGVCKLRHRTSR